MPTTVTRTEIDEFLSQPRLAVVGVSRGSKEFANSLFRDLRKLGYQAVPVNPHVEELEGERCFARVQDIAPAVDAALLLTPPAVNEQVVRDCAQAGIKHVWLYGVGDRSADNPRAIALCKQEGIAVILSLIHI